MYVYDVMQYLEKPKIVVLIAEERLNKFKERINMEKKGDREGPHYRIEDVTVF